MDGGGDSGSSSTDAGARDSAAGGAEAEGGTSHMDSGATRDASEAGPSDAAMEASAPDVNVPLTSRCAMGSTAACSSFVNALDVEVAMGPYGAVMDRNVGAGFEAPNEMSTSCPLFLDGFGLAASVVEKLVDVTALDMALHTVYRPARWATGQRYPLILWGNDTCMQPEA